MNVLEHIDHTIRMVFVHDVAIFTMSIGILGVVLSLTPVDQPKVMRGLYGIVFLVGVALYTYSVFA